LVLVVYVAMKEFHDEVVRILLPFGFHTPKYRSGQRGETTICFQGIKYLIEYPKTTTINLVRDKARQVLDEAFEHVMRTRW
jgi:hypothetical protein